MKDVASVMLKISILATDVCQAAMV
jgi:hypothetical protein